MAWSDAIADWWIKDDVERGKQLDDELAALNRSSLERGVWTEEQYQGAETRRTAEAAETYGGQVSDAFDEGWREGEQTVANVVRDTTAGVLGTAASVTTAPLRGLLSGLPWWAWILGGVALLAWSGMLPGVVSSLRSSFKR